MLPGLPAWASELAWVSDGDQFLPSAMDGINVVLNRARLATYLSQFGDDKDVRDLLILDAVAHAAGLAFTSTGAPEAVPSLALRPFRIWEYAWLFKILGLSKGGVQILDLGGPATHLSILAALAGCNVTSIDINPEFVRAAQVSAETLGLSSFNSRVGDMRDLSSFGDESFDVVLSCSVLEHLTAADQECAVAEMARVLKPGGLIGLTFDYGQAAPGANEYLPPPHDPPPTAQETLRRYVRAGLEVVGNQFAEDPTPGALFPDEQVRYTIASLFLAKAPVPEVPLPRCERRGSSLGSLVIPMLPSRMHKSAAHTQAMLNSLRTDLGGERSSYNELSENGNGNNRNGMHAQLEAVRREAEERERGLHELTRVIAVRDARIAELEQIADERLAVINRGAEELRAAAAVVAGLDAQQRRDEARLSESTERQATLSKQLLALERETLLEYVTRRVSRLKAGSSARRD
jgi:2-polyprenyl-3-methyl-5-hydroxy-6-metoxy-1,4-benzoquinol methylase